MLISWQNNQYAKKSIFCKLANFWAALSKHSKLMGPEEIHIFFWEGAPRPPKRKCDRPKNLEVF